MRHYRTALASFHVACMGMRPGLLLLCMDCCIKYAAVFIFSLLPPPPKKTAVKNESPSLRIPLDTSLGFHPPAAIADLDGDGRLEVAYALVWGNIDRNAALITPPKLLVEVLTLEDRFTEVYGEERVDFSRFLPSAQQPWSRYMGATGDGVFRLQH